MLKLHINEFLKIYHLKLLYWFNNFDHLWLHLQNVASGEQLSQTSDFPTT